MSISKQLFPYLIISWACVQSRKQCYILPSERSALYIDIDKLKTTSRHMTLCFSVKLCNLISYWYYLNSLSFKIIKAIFWNIEIEISIFFYWHVLFCIYWMHILLRYSSLYSLFTKLDNFIGHVICQFSPLSPCLQICINAYDQYIGWNYGNFLVCKT